MTVLILSLSVPLITPTKVSAENIQLIHSLRALLPDILSYVISFAILGSFWIRHHSILNFVTSVNRILLWLNILFLLTIGFIPFSTALIGRYPTLQLSLIVYGSNLIATGLTSQFLWIYAVKEGLVAHDTSDEELISRTNRRMTAGPITYLVGILVSFFSPTATLLIYILALIFFMANTGISFKLERRIFFGRRPDEGAKDND
jgi:uncharacterized membrane protein